MKKCEHHNPTHHSSNRHSPGAIAATEAAHPFVKAYVKHLKGKRYDIGTIEKRLYAVRCLFLWNDQGPQKRLQDLNAADMEKYQAHERKRDIAGATADCLIADNKKFFQFLEESGRIFISPMSKTVIRWTPRRLKHVPTEDDMSKLLAAVDTTRPNGVRDRALLEVMYSTGARMGELLRMSVFDPDLDRGTVRVFGKGKKERTVPLGKHAISWLRHYLKTARPKFLVRPGWQARDPSTTALWLGKDGDPIKKSRVDQIVKAASNAAGLTPAASSHAVRRACATHMLRNGAHPVQIQMLLGHANLNSLSQYLHVSIRDLHAMHRKTRLGR